MAIETLSRLVLWNKKVPGSVFHKYAVCRKEKNYMSRRIVEVSNLVDAIENNMISIGSVENKTKISVDITETNLVTPEKFIESIQFLNETIFKDAIDFFYEFTGTNNILIECGMKNIYMEEYYRVECVISDGISIDDVNKKFRETIFDRMNKKLAV